MAAAPGPSGGAPPSEPMGGRLGTHILRTLSQAALG